MGFVARRHRPAPCGGTCGHSLVLTGASCRPPRPPRRCCGSCAASRYSAVGQCMSGPPRTLWRALRACNKDCILRQDPVKGASLPWEMIADTRISCASRTKLRPCCAHSHEVPRAPVLSPTPQHAVSALLSPSQGRTQGAAPSRGGGANKRGCRDTRVRSEGAS